MNLTEPQIEKFQRLFFTEYGKHISFDNAKIELEKIIEMVKCVYRPLKKEDAVKTKNYAKKESN
jgi:hypothetical protein